MQSNVLNRSLHKTPKWRYEYVERCVLSLLKTENGYVEKGFTQSVGSTDSSLLVGTVFSQYFHFNAQFYVYIMIINYWLSSLPWLR